MLYISPENEYPRHIGDIQAANPEWDANSDLPIGWIAVQSAEPPTVLDGQMLQELFPQEISGAWVQVWAVRDMTADEIEARNAPITAKQRLKSLGFSDLEIQAIGRGLL